MEIHKLRRSKLSTEEYQIWDIPVKCLGCGRWMRNDPRKPPRKTKRPLQRVYVKRAAIPHAGYCVVCRSTENLDAIRKQLRDER